MTSDIKSLVSKAAQTTDDTILWSEQGPIAAMLSGRRLVATSDLQDRYYQRITELDDQIVALTNELHEIKTQIEKIYKMKDNRFEGAIRLDTAFAPEASYISQLFESGYSLTSIADMTMTPEKLATTALSASYKAARIQLRTLEAKREEIALQICQEKFDDHALLRLAFSPKQDELEAHKTAISTLYHSEKSQEGQTILQIGFSLTYRRMALHLDELNKYVERSIKLLETKLHQLDSENESKKDQIAAVKAVLGTENDGLYSFRKEIKGISEIVNNLKTPETPDEYTQLFYHGRGKILELNNKIINFKSTIDRVKEVEQAGKDKDSDNTVYKLLTKLWRDIFDKIRIFSPLDSTVKSTHGVLNEVKTNASSLSMFFKPAPAVGATKSQAEDETAHVSYKPLMK